MRRCPSQYHALFAEATDWKRRGMMDACVRRAKPGQRRSRQEMLEAEFEADRKRKDAQTSEEARRERRALDDALARVARLERAAKRERRDRADRLKRDAEKRARAMKLVRPPWPVVVDIHVSCGRSERQRVVAVQDNEVSDDEGEGAAAARRSARGRAERLAEKERDEADALRELEEQATTSAGGDEGGGVKMEEEDLKKDAVFQAMIQESKLKPAAAPKEEEDKAEDTGGGGGGGGGWATVGVAGGWDNGGAGAAAAPRAPTAAKRALFDDGSAEDARKQAGAQWMLQAKAARAAAAEPGAVPAAGAPAPGSREAFVAERDQVRRSARVSVMRLMSCMRRCHKIVAPALWHPPAPVTRFGQRLWLCRWLQRAGSSSRSCCGVTHLS